MRARTASPNQWPSGSRRCAGIAASSVGGLHRLQEARLRRAPEIAGVDRDEDVRGAVRALRRQALDQGCAVIRDGLHLDATLPAVFLEQLFDQLVLARGVDHEGLTSGLGGARECHAGQYGEQPPGGSGGRCESS